MMTLKQIVGGLAGNTPEQKADACLELLAELPTGNGTDAAKAKIVAEMAQTYALLEIARQFELTRGARTSW